MSEFKLPDVGEGLTEAEIVSWKVKVGDVIAVNDIIVEIETAKSLVELPSPYAGTVLALMVPEGEMVAVGTPIISVGDPNEAPPPSATPDAEMEIDLSNPRASGGGEGESLVGRNKADRGAVRRTRKAAAPATPASQAGAGTQEQLQGAFTPGAEPTEVEESDEPAVPATSARPEEAERPAEFVPRRATSPQEVRALAKPPVRKLAKDLGVDLASCEASGPHGSVTRADVEAAADGGAAQASPAAAGRRAARRPRVSGRPASRSRASAR